MLIDLEREIIFFYGLFAEISFFHSYLMYAQSSVVVSSFVDVAKLPKTK